MDLCLVLSVIERENSVVGHLPRASRIKRTLQMLARASCRYVTTCVVSMRQRDEEVEGSVNLQV
jgi:hypothetical protein